MGTTQPAAESINLIVVAALAANAVIMTALFAWLAIIGWARQRRLEREAFYRHELERQMAERGVLGPEQLADLDRARAIERWRQRREGLKLSGFLCLALAVGLFLVLWRAGDPVIRNLGFIPISIGAALLGYEFFSTRGLVSSND